jgi:hypothetical protein
VKRRRTGMTSAKTAEPHDVQRPHRDSDTRGTHLEPSERDDADDLEEGPTEQGVDLDPKRRID